LVSTFTEETQISSPVNAMFEKFLAIFVISL
jgi:hypothetical protein